MVKLVGWYFEGIKGSMYMVLDIGMLTLNADLGTGTDEF